MEPRDLAAPATRALRLPLGRAVAGRVRARGRGARRAPERAARGRRRGRRSARRRRAAPRTRAPPPARSGSCRAYGDALVEAAERRAEPRRARRRPAARLRLVEFRERFPDRFFECGIAEQDMVSQAGAMALAGLLPVVHSFACFLSTRPNEQIYNNATEGTKVIYVGSLAGLVPGGPGHSHQSVRDISALGAVPGHGAARAREPARGPRGGPTGRWTRPRGRSTCASYRCRGRSASSCPRRSSCTGAGPWSAAGDDVMFVASGPVMLSQACAGRRAARASAASAADAHRAALAARRRRRSGSRSAAAPAGRSSASTTTTRRRAGGRRPARLQGRHDAAAGRVVKLGVDRLPVCGTNDEVLRAHGLDAESLTPRMAAYLNAYASSPG